MRFRFETASPLTDAYVILPTAAVLGARDELDVLILIHKESDEEVNSSPKSCVLGACVGIDDVFELSCTPECPTGSSGCLCRRSATGSPNNEFRICDTGLQCAGGTVFQGGAKCEGTTVQGCLGW